MSLLYQHPAAHVTPLAGVWIEIIYDLTIRKRLTVTPLAGVWIEIFDHTHNQKNWSTSLPLRECGLKFQ